MLTNRLSCDAVQHIIEQIHTRKDAVLTCKYCNVPLLMRWAIRPLICQVPTYCVCDSRHLFVVSCLNPNMIYTLSAYDVVDSKKNEILFLQTPSPIVVAPFTPRWISMDDKCFKNEQIIYHQCKWYKIINDDGVCATCFFRLRQRRKIFQKWRLYGQNN